MKRSLPWKFILLVTSYALLVTELCGCQQKQLYKDSRMAMGTFVEITSAHKNAAEIALAEIARIENLISKYKPDSEIAQLNKLGKLKVSPDTLHIIKKAEDYWRATDGVFDITVAPLLDIWGFTDKNYRLPKQSEIKETLRLVGFNKVIIDEKNSMVELSLPGMKIDLGAIGQGYAVDSAIKKLKQAGINSCLINAGGDIYALGDKFGRPWNIAIQDPRGKDVMDYLQLRDKAVSTSGDYEQYFMVKKKRYAHIFNPKTGYPTESGVISVTVIAPDCTTADALDTSIFVLGKVKGQELARRFPGVEVKIVEEGQ